jgi:hypothetical protein
MRKLILLPLLTLAFACDDGTLVQPSQNLDVTPQASLHPTNPFIGSWWGIDWEDNSLHRVTISHENEAGDMQVNFRDDAMALCGGLPGKYHAIGRIVSENVLKVFDLVATCQGPDGAVLDYGSVVGYQYVPADDQLLYCLVPENAPTVCVMSLSREKS